MSEPAKAIAYIRVSRVGKRQAEGTFESPDIQRQACAQWCAQRGIAIVAEHEDLNQTGGNLTRTGLQTALQLIRDGLANGIIVYRADRASRKTIDGLGLTEQLETLGAWIAATDGSIDTTTRAGRMNTTFRFAIAQDELERYRENAAAVHTRAILDKKRHMGPAGFGYIRDKNNRLTPDPQGGHARPGIVAMLYTQRANGWGWTRLSEAVDETGILQRSGRRLSPTHIQRIIRNRVYIGEAHHGSLVMPDAHPALVNEALWQAANHVQPTTRAYPRRRGQNPQPLLRGLLRCATCRHAMKRVPDTMRRDRWICRTLARDRSATHHCPNPARLTGLEGEHVHQHVIDRLFDLAEGAGAETRPDDTARLHDQAELARIDRELDGLADIEVRRSLGPERWAGMAADLRAERSLVERRLARRTVSDVSRVVGLRAAWPGLDADARHDVLSASIRAVMVLPGDVPAVERVFVVPAWQAIELPSRGRWGFDAGPWLPESVS